MKGGFRIEKVKTQVRDDKLIIGESPKFIVDLKDGSSYIQVHNQKIPYMKKIRFSEDLLSGKRNNVFETAVSYYYDQACKVAEGYRIAAFYSKIAYNRNINKECF